MKFLNKSLWILLTLGLMSCGVFQVGIKPRSTPTETTAVSPSQIGQPTASVSASTPTAQPMPSNTPTAAVPNPTHTIQVLPPTPAPALDVAPVAASIESFSIDRDQVTLGDMITLSWRATGGQVSLCLSPELAQPPCTFVPLVGTQLITIDKARRNQSKLDFVLYSYPAPTGQPVSAMVSATVTCNPWFFLNPPDECASYTANKWASIQYFEHGAMLWFQDYGETYILVDAVSPLKPYHEATDTLGVPLPGPDSTIVPPPGLYQPVLGFAKFWRGLVPGYDWVRDRLGWATEPEVGYSSFYQCNGGLRDEARCYVSTPNGEVLVLGRGNALYWSVWKGALDAALPKLPGRVACYGSENFLAVINADGSGFTERLTFARGFQGFSFSPDGKQLAFSARSGDKAAEIYLVNTQGPVEIVQLTDNDFDDIQPAWSPNGKQIAFVSRRQSEGGIYLMNVDGSSQHLILNTYVTDWHPSWSPDSKQLAFHGSEDDQATAGIYVINSDGTGRARLTREKDVNPAWSPDGKRLAFETHRPPEQAPHVNPFQIYLINVDGGNLTSLTTDASPSYQPVWSPDSQWIAFHVLSDRGQSVVFVAKADGAGGTYPLVNNAACTDKAWGL